MWFEHWLWISEYYVNFVLLCRSMTSPQYVSYEPWLLWCIQQTIRPRPQSSKFTTDKPLGFRPRGLLVVNFQ